MELRIIKSIKIFLIFLLKILDKIFNYSKNEKSFKMLFEFKI